MAVLIADRKGAAWAQVKDDHIKDFASALQKVRFFPIILNCKGRLPTEGGEISLQRIIEQAMEESLSRFGLQHKVTVGTSDEIQAWWQKAPHGVKNDLTRYIQSQYQGRPTPDDLETKRGPEAFTKAILEASRAIHIEITFTRDIRRRFSHIYRQLTQDHGFHGLVVVIDEFKSWQDLHPPGSQGFAEDEHVLEDLGLSSAGGRPCTDHHDRRVASPAASKVDGWDTW